jgi:hypothetical protein
MSSGVEKATVKGRVMSEFLLDKLLRSFDELDRCISVTKQVLSTKDGVPADVLKRVEQYSDIVNKQRSLADDLKSFLDREDWTEVNRHVRLINGLSAMIRDDAQAILATAQGMESLESKDQSLC